jgi:transposase
MWTPTTRQQHSRPVKRYQTDLTDAEWRVIAPHLPKPCATGRPREWPMREILNGIFYVMRAGCPWRLLPNDLPPWETIYRWFAAWRGDGRFERMNHALRDGRSGTGRPHHRREHPQRPARCPARRCAGSGRKPHLGNGQLRRKPISNVIDSQILRERAVLCLNRGVKASQAASSNHATEMPSSSTPVAR